MKQTIDDGDLVRSNFRLRQLASDLAGAAAALDALFDIRVKVGAVIGEMEEQAFEGNPHSGWGPDKLREYVAKLREAIGQCVRAADKPRSGKPKPTVEGMSDRHI